MTKIDELRSQPATNISCCILFVALHGDASAKVLAEQAAAEYLQSFQHSVVRTAGGHEYKPVDIPGLSVYCEKCGELLSRR